MGFHRWSWEGESHFASGAALRRASRVALAACLAAPAVIGCGAEDGKLGPGIEVEPGFVAADCSGGSQKWLAGLTAEPPFDYAALSFAGFVEERGTQCAGASDLASCRAKVSALPDEYRLEFGPLIQAQNVAKLTITRGDEAFLVEGTADLVDLLAPIDTPADAMLLVQNAGYDVRCGDGGARPSGDGFDVQAFIAVCETKRYLFHVTAAGGITLIGQDSDHRDPSTCPIVGRRPRGLRRGRANLRANGVAEHFARCATLEAASVVAFDRLHAELHAHGAPRALRDRARAAARDEIRHARVVRGLAGRFGGAAEAPRVRSRSLRGLEAIALENAIEGCVRETYGALVAEWQSLRAADPAVRAAFRRIAKDEYRHAALSWNVAQWAEPRLSPVARGRVQDARREAAQSLLTELGIEPSDEVRILSGIPDATTARTLARGLFERIGVRVG